MARRRIIDWHTPDGLDPETPVVDLHDSDDAGRDAIVLISDEERRAWAWALELWTEQRNRHLLEQSLTDAADRETVIAMRHERRRWHDKVWARLGIIAAVLAGLNIPQWVQLFQRH